MTFDYVLGRAPNGMRAAFTVDAEDRGAADEQLVDRMLGGGWSVVELLYWQIVSVTELGRRA